MKKLFLVLVLLPTILYSQIQKTSTDTSFYQHASKTPSQLGGVVVGETNIGSKAFWDDYVFARFVEWYDKIAQMDSINYTAFQFDSSLTVGPSPTGGHKGDGTVNVSSGYYINGVMTSAETVLMKPLDAIAWFPMASGGAIRDTINIEAGAPNEEVYLFSNSTTDSLECKFFSEVDADVTLDSVQLFLTTASTSGDSVAFVLDHSGYVLTNIVLVEIPPVNTSTSVIDMGVVANTVKGLVITFDFNKAFSDHPLMVYLRLSRDNTIDNNLAADVRFHGLIIYYHKN